MTLLARVVSEHRRVLIPLGLLAVVNVGLTQAYVMLVPQRIA